MNISNDQQREFVALLNQNRRIAYKLCNSYFDDPHEREDVFQMISMAAWKGFSKFRFESKFSTWLYNVSRYTIIDILRKKKNKPEFVAIDPFSSKIVVDEGEAEIKEIQQEELQRLINLLPEIERDTVCLYLLGESYQRIASLMDVKENVVRVRMYRIRQFMKKRMKADLY